MITLVETDKLTEYLDSRQIIWFFFFEMSRQLCLIFYPEKSHFRLTITVYDTFFKNSFRKYLNFI